MTLYSVEVERQQRVYVYVDADTEEEAEEAAVELVDFYDFEDSVDTWAREIKSVPVFREVWVGGPDGNWVDGKVYNENA